MNVSINQLIEKIRMKNRISTEDLEKRITKIEERNKRVEMDKDWETSWGRKIILAFLTYFVVVLFFKVNKLPNPLTNAVVPTLGFVLSTLTVSIFKNIWIKYHKK